MGFAGAGLIFSLVTGGLIAWAGPLGFMAICQFALIANYSEPLTWAARPATDCGGWIAAMIVYAIGLAAFTIRIRACARRASNRRHSGSFRNWTGP